MTLAHHVLSVSLVLVFLCSTAQGQVKKSVTAVAFKENSAVAHNQKVFNTLFTDVAGSFSNLGGTMAGSYEQIGSYTQTGVCLRVLLPRALYLAAATWRV
jgi:hypothetical protein